MGAHDEGLDLIVAAKKDPRYSKMKGEEPDMDGGDEDESSDGDALDGVFSKSQAAAIRQYVSDCK
jgi:hypothetical protein